MKEPQVSMPVIRRLPRYYRFLCELQESGVPHISSGELARRMGLTASQVRQDLHCFGGFGQQGCGYPVALLRETLENILGLSARRPALLIGAGNIGRGIVRHMDFAVRGFSLRGILDDDPLLAGRVLCGLTIRPTVELEALCAAQHPVAAILCIPKESAPPLVERLLACGVRGFWNFSHYDIAYHHPEAIVENVHLGDSLMTFSYLLQQADEPAPADPASPPAAE